MFRTLVNVPELSRVGNQVSKESEYKAKQWKEQFRFLTNLLTNLLIAKFRLKLNKVGKTTRPFRYDLNQIPYNHTVEVRNRFKWLDLIYRVPDELWMEVHDIVQETGIKTIPKKKKCKKAKWLSEEALQIAVKRREVKTKEERKDIPIWMQSSKEQQGEIRKPSSVISAKK